MYFLKEMLVFVIFSCFILCNSLKPNFVFFLTDDQDLLLNGMVPMRKTIELIGNKGVTFRNAFVNSPICCPSRSTILTGKYIHNMGVTNNSINGNCSSKYWQANFEPNSVAAILKHEKNYNTFYAGKYLNQYGDKKCGGLQHIPKGYDWWIGLQGNSKYYNYTLSVNGTRTDYADEYFTDVIKDYALSFLNQGHIVNSPFFMMLSPPASHAPFTPASRHESRYVNVKTIRNPSFNYTSVDKHWVVTIPPKYLPENITILDDIHRGRLQTLLAVDEMVEAVFLKLKQLDILNNTYMIFTSDNGFHIGQFTQPWDKRQPYETDIRVPFLMSGPKIKKKQVLLKPISMVDVAPTILDLAKVTNDYDMDGRSFKKHIFKIRRTNRNLDITNILIQYFGEGNEHTVDRECSFPASDLSQCTLSNWCKCQDSRNNTYACVRQISKTVDYKFCRFYDDLNYIEAYDLKSDPYELSNLYGNMSEDKLIYYQNLLDNLLNNR